jgi:hypothetical protein
VLALAAVLATVAAHANGAFPDEFSIHFPANAPHRIYVGANFGLLVTEDDGGLLEIPQDKLQAGHSARQLRYQDLCHALLSAVVIKAVLTDPIAMEEIPVVTLAVEDQALEVDAGVAAALTGAVGHPRQAELDKIDALTSKSGLPAILARLTTQLSYEVWRLNCRYVVSTKPMAQQMGQPRKASSDTPAKANE